MVTSHHLKSSGNINEKLLSQNDVHHLKNFVFLVITPLDIYRFLDTFKNISTCYKPRGLLTSHFPSWETYKAPYFVLLSAFAKSCVPFVSPASFPVNIIWVYELHISVESHSGFILYISLYPFLLCAKVSILLQPLLSMS